MSPQVWNLPTVLPLIGSQNSSSSCWKGALMLCCTVTWPGHLWHHFVGLRSCTGTDDAAALMTAQMHVLGCSPVSCGVFSAGGLGEDAVQSIVWHASDRRPAPIVANATIERLGLAQWDASALPFAALVSSGRHTCSDYIQHLICSAASLRSMLFRLLSPLPCALQALYTLPLLGITPLLEMHSS